MVEILGKDAVKDLFENGRVDKETLLFETEMRFANMNIKNAADELLLRLEKGILDKKLFELSRLLDAATDSEKKETLKKETQKISQRIADLNK